MEDSLTYYKRVLRYDAMHVEAVACIATHHFYTDQPEVALKYYRCVICSYGRVRCHDLRKIFS